MKLPNGGMLKIEMNHMDTPFCQTDWTSNDSKILAITKNLQEQDKDKPTILVTKDLYMAIKGDALGIQTEDYETDKIATDKIYQGHRELFLPSSDIDKICTEGLPLPTQLDFPVYPNEFLNIKSNDRMNHEILARYDGKKIVPLKYSNYEA